MTTTDSYACPNCGNAGVRWAECHRNPGCTEGGYHCIALDGQPRDARLGQKFGRYLVVGTIGAGGHGAVYRARHELTGQVAALKLLTGMGARGFEREARALAQLSHRNVVRIYDFGQAHECDFLVMEYVDGLSLADFLTQTPSLAVLEDVFDQIVAALGHAHRRGIIHRDMKPSNVMMQFDEPERPFARIVDFGLAKDFDQNDQTTQLKGTAAYMAPEQIDRADLGPWTDLYAVGCMIYEVVSGQRAFRGSYRQIVFQKTLQSYDPIAHLGPDTPAPVVEFLKDALAPATSARIRDAATFRARMRTAFSALADAGHRPVGAAQQVADTPARVSIADDDSASVPAGTPEVGEPSRRQWVFPGGIGMLALVAFAWVSSTSDSVTGPAPPSASSTAANAPQSLATQAAATQAPATALPLDSGVDALVDMQVDAAVDAAPASSPPAAVKTALRRKAPRRARKPRRSSVVTAEKPIAPSSVVQPVSTAPRSQPARPAGPPAEIRALRRFVAECDCTPFWARYRAMKKDGRADILAKWSVSPDQCKPVLDRSLQYCKDGVPTDIKGKGR